MIDNWDARVRTVREVREIVYGVIECSKPVIAAVEGTAVGAGLSVAMLADVCIVTPDAKLIDGHTRLGVAAGDHAVMSWPISMGLAKAKYYLLTCRTLTGADAERMGLVALCVSAEDLAKTALDTARELADGAQQAIAWTKHALNGWMRGSGDSFELSLAYELLGGFSGRRAGRDSRRSSKSGGPSSAASRPDRGLNGEEVMELRNEFAVRVPIDKAWALLTDLEQIAPCMPGAKLEEVRGEDYLGLVKVKVGPITSSYKGKASFVERDDEKLRAVLRAEGRDMRGQGNAHALITAQLEPDGEQTRVTVVTELNITGKIAQFGRGALADVSTKLLEQFVRDAWRRACSASGPGTGGGVGDRADQAGGARASRPAGTVGVPPVVRWGVPRA